LGTGPQDDVPSIRYVKTVVFVCIWKAAACRTYGNGRKEEYVCSLFKKKHDNILESNRFSNRIVVDNFSHYRKLSQK
jgi:hypothetical protein